MEIFKEKGGQAGNTQLYSSAGADVDKGRGERKEREEGERGRRERKERYEAVSDTRVRAD